MSGSASELSGRRVLVTGADLGIGQGIAVAMAAAGADVAIHYPPEGPGPDETVAMVERSGRQAAAVKGDLAEAAACHAVVDEAVDRLGGLDVLVNNAGITRTADFTEIDEQFFATVMGINFGGQFFCAQRAVPAIREAGGGSIVNLSSVQGTRGYPGSSVYAASKGAIEGWTRALAMELAPSIRVNAIAPGSIETPRFREIPNYSREKAGSHNPLGRIGLPDDIADVAVFLVSDASRYVTGQVLHVDGGATAH